MLVTKWIWPMLAIAPVVLAADIGEQQHYRRTNDTEPEEAIGSRNGDGETPADTVELQCGGGCHDNIIYKT